MPDQKTPDSLEGALNRGTDAMMTAKGAYGTAQGIGAASAGVGASAGTGAAAGTAVGGPAGTALGAVGGLAAGFLLNRW